MKLDLAYGTVRANAKIDWGRCLGILDIVDAPAPANLESLIRQAIELPIGLDRSIYDIVKPSESVAIIVCDSFRKSRVDRILPILIEGLNRAGISDESILFVFATGSHRAPTPEEQKDILGSAVYDRFSGQLLSHDPRDESNLVEVGVTSRGTRVRINKRVLECDRIIATGTVVLHYFAGFGGGRKMIVPGISGLDTISQNHARTLHPTEDRINPAVRVAALDGNPVAEDMLEGARFVKVDYLINTVLNRHGEIAAVFAGEMDAAHRAAADCAQDLYLVPIRERADLVIASSGPMRNYVQTHKALYNAYQAVKPNGRIVLLARCEEGIGGEQFVKWLRVGDRKAIIAELRKNSEINGQTALSTVEKGPITFMVTDMPEPDVALLRARKASSLAAALAAARAELPPSPTYYVMPSAAYSVPFVA